MIKMFKTAKKPRLTLCEIRGHLDDNRDREAHSNYYGLNPHAIDGIGREHASIRARCKRCGQLFSIGNVHLVMRRNEKLLLEKALPILEKDLDMTSPYTEEWEELVKLVDRVRKTLKS